MYVFLAESCFSAFVLFLGSRRMAAFLPQPRVFSERDRLVFRLASRCSPETFALPVHNQGLIVSNTCKDSMNNRRKHPTLAARSRNRWFIVSGDKRRLQMNGVLQRCALGWDFCSHQGNQPPMFSSGSCLRRADARVREEEDSNWSSG